MVADAAVGLGGCGQRAQRPLLLCTLRLRTLSELCQCLLAADPALCALCPTDFLTEGGDGAGEGGAAAAATAEPCGLAASVPRVLRWPHRVPLQHLTLEHTEALVAAIWKVRWGRRAQQPACTAR